MGFAMTSHPDLFIARRSDLISIRTQDNKSLSSKPSPSSSFDPSYHVSRRNGAEHLEIRDERPVRQPSPRHPHDNAITICPPLLFFILYITVNSVGTRSTRRNWQILRITETKGKSGTSSTLLPTKKPSKFGFLFRFGEDSVEKMVEWSLTNLPPPQTEIQQRILEVGSGNGTLLFALAEAGYALSSLHGIDYSQGAVQLARNISATKGFAGSDEEGEGKGKSPISFEKSDFLTQDPPFPLSSSEEESVAVWDLLLDKGTYDAIALGPKDPSTGRSPAVHYPGRVTRLLKQGGYFLITCTSLPFVFLHVDDTYHPACNFTEEELTNAFVSEETGLVYQQVFSLFFIDQLTNGKKFPHSTPDVYLRRQVREHLLERSIPKEVKTSRTTCHYLRLAFASISTDLRSVSLAASTAHLTKSPKSPFASNDNPSPSPTSKNS